MTTIMMTMEVMMTMSEKEEKNKRMNTEE